MKTFLKTVPFFLFVLIHTDGLYAQQLPFTFGQAVSSGKIMANSKEKEVPLKWFNVNTEADTWSLKNGVLMCTGKPIGVMRSEKQ